MMARLLRLLARFEDFWLADVLGAICLFALIPVTLYLGLLLEAIGLLWGIK